MLERGLVGRTEHDVAVDLEHTMRVLGAEAPSFGSIVASGAHGALPHAEPRAEAIAARRARHDRLGRAGWTATARTARARTRRETWRTTPPAVYELVRARAAEVGGRGARRCATARRSTPLGREEIAAAGHGDHYGHGLGHGVGLEVHEGPKLSPRSKDTLVAGNVVTVEPGVYVPDRFGVRIEDLVVVTDDGCDVLSGLPKSLTVVG